MNVNNLLNQFMGGQATAGTQTVPNQGYGVGGLGGSLGKFASNIPGGLAGGAAAGGVMALLLGSKSARKIAAKTATYGGAAILGGIAYSAFKNWKSHNANAAASAAPQSADFRQAGGGNYTYRQSNQSSSEDFQLRVIKAMIAAAKADGHIDAEEQQRIFDAVAQMDLDAQTKGLIFDLLRQPIFIEELSEGALSLEQKSELYLASCLAINPDHPSEQAHLGKLAQALQLPPGLAEEIKWQARLALSDQ